MGIEGLFHPDMYLQYGPWGLAFALGAFSLLFEDIAILIGITLVQQHPMLTQAVLLGLYGGFVSGDMLIYTAGRWMKNMPFIARRMATAAVQSRVTRMRGHIVTMLVLCRAIPASRLPTFLAAGVLKVPVLKYLCISLTTASLWVMTTVVVGVNIAQMVRQHLGFSSAWLLLPLVLIAVYFMARSKRQPHAA